VYNNALWTIVNLAIGPGPPSLPGATLDLPDRGAASRGDIATAVFACPCFMVRIFFPKLKSNPPSLPIKALILPVGSIFLFDLSFAPPYLINSSPAPYFQEIQAVQASTGVRSRAVVSCMVICGLDAGQKFYA